jgi:hypothetical protein
MHFTCSAHESKAVALRLDQVLAKPTLVEVTGADGSQVLSVCVVMSEPSIALAHLMKEMETLGSQKSGFFFGGNVLHIMPGSLRGGVEIHISGLTVRPLE